MKGIHIYIYLSYYTSSIKYLIVRSYKREIKKRGYIYTHVSSEKK